ncbi:carbohydrate ABC transporter permease [Streptomyces cocklensis]|jgi:N-acetylglucosamine transport system permease protein|uniref:Diacetylchitobiose uptake system permease protein NgcG n=1 Tax=Actinacidiphila cocklensis TaxID=887465 RepID=A0A9W4DXH1_9ACTN|nr:carbohydrate ABC transporter permease [Actinacidiphila cocklensis]MDD1059505.1 carbohydrate ABC transporter permease [Actinacidiphila cocklensis]WSX76279.1 carbohydrate ABC transporter permease [Streptomyces sp. NBC_00899]CAG6397955.1 Diacetylchitobiose uptake system permease protein NgcG [Actinacidiphila cocklensis]
MTTDTIEDATPGSPPRKSGTPASNAARWKWRRSEGGVLNAFSHVFLAVWGLMVGLPLLWALWSSFKSSGDILSHPLSLPTHFHFENWSHAWSKANMGQYFINTVIVVGFSTLGTMLFGSMAAYVLARFEFPGNRLIYFTFVGGMAFPVVMVLVPLFFVTTNLGIINTLPGLILVYIAYSLPFTVFFMASFFRTLPTSVAEAALVDGASHTRTFFQIMVPMAKPGIISIGIFNVLGQWNQYLLPLVLNQGDTSKWVLTQGLADLAVQQGYQGDWGGLFAGLSIAMLPVLAVYIVFQRQVQAGLTAGALK